MRIAHAKKDFLQEKPHIFQVENYPFLIRATGLVTISEGAFSFEVHGHEEIAQLRHLDAACQILESGNFKKEDRSGYPVIISGNSQDDFYFEF